MKHRKLKDNLYWLGVKDPDLRVFDIVIPTKYGSTYNSYLLKGNTHNTLIDTVKINFLDDFLTAIEELIPFKNIDYLIVNHTEPDHAGSIERMVEINPNITLVGSPTALKFLQEIINRPFKSIPVKENDILSLGDKTLQFMLLPNLHWPDTMVTYVQEDKILFTCDFLGAHFCPQELLLSELSDIEKKNHREDFKHYYDCIMAPFPSFINKALRRLDGMEIKMVCTGHGPILDEKVHEFMQLYENYSRKHVNEIPVLVIPFASSYGYTKMLANLIAQGARSAGNIDVQLYDMNEHQFEDVMAAVDHADGILLGSPTFLSDAVKPIWDIAITLNPVIHGGKFTSAFGSYGWTGEAVPLLVERLKNCRMKVTDGYRIRFKPSDQEKEAAVNYGKEFGTQLLAHVESKR